jgi:hypothetical protein
MITKGENRALDLVEERRGGARAAEQVAVGDVASTHQHDALVGGLRLCDQPRPPTHDQQSKSERGGNCSSQRGLRSAL